MKTATVRKQLSERCPNIFVLLEFVLDETQVGLYIASAEEIMLYQAFVCLSVCLSVR